jgi:hypothetical protein
MFDVEEESKKCQEAHKTTPGRREKRQGLATYKPAKDTLPTFEKIENNHLGMG